jgi:hypothetical protein
VTTVINGFIGEYYGRLQKEFGAGCKTPKAFTIIINVTTAGSTDDTCYTVDCDDISFTISAYKGPYNNQRIYLITSAKYFTVTSIRGAGIINLIDAPSDTSNFISIPRLYNNADLRISGNRLNTFDGVNDKWVDADGATAGIARSGASGTRPSSSDIYVGIAGIFDPLPDWMERTITHVHDQLDKSV